jgi:hypothetical protein
LALAGLGRRADLALVARVTVLAKDLDLAWDVVQEQESAVALGRGFPLAYNFSFRLIKLFS